MKNVKVDQEGNLRCWKCGGKQFLAKRTGRAHVIGYLTVGVGALATKKKLKCQQCGEYNQVGNAEPYAERAVPKPEPSIPRSFRGTAPGWHFSESLSRWYCDAHGAESCRVCAVPPIEQATKTCPDCAETIKSAAQVCRHCGLRFEDRSAD